jgi:signal transduction histidine kinase
MIQPGQGRLEFSYTGLFFTAPERVRFKYRLDGLEHEWVEAGARRSVPYSYLPPGDYTFHVTACNDDGVWNEAGASLALTVQPHYWQTWSFHILSAVLAAAALSGLVLFAARRRMRQKLERLEHQQAVERERARIARDIHDDLGANLTRITMLSQSFRDETEPAEEREATLDLIYQTARDLTRAMDEIVWAVNPRHDSLDSLASYLGKLAQDFLRPAGIRCRLELPMQLPPLPLTAETRHNLFLAFKEALNNVVKHAHASEVRVVLILNGAGFTLTVEDNGRGFAPEKLAAAPSPSPDRVAGGNGLSNMRHRLEKLGGKFEIISAPGSGTQVRFSLPAKLDDKTRLVPSS